MRLLAIVLFLPAPPTTSPCTLSLHDALPSLRIDDDGATELATEPVDTFAVSDDGNQVAWTEWTGDSGRVVLAEDRKSTRLNSSHVATSYAVFCLNKKKQHDPSASDLARAGSH